MFFIIMSATKVCAGCKFERALDEFKTAKGGAVYDNCNKCFLANNKLFWQDKAFKVCRQCKDKLPIEAFTRDANGCPWPQCKCCYTERVKLQHRQKQRTAAIVLGGNQVEGK